MPTTTIKTTGKPLRVPLNKISRFEGQPRRYFNAMALERLADSLMSGPNGAITQEIPIKICIDPYKEGHYILVDGERRFRAFHIVAKRKGFEPLVDAFVAEINDPAEHFRQSMVANLHREDLSDLDEGAALHQMHASGTGKKELAKIIGKSYSYVDNYIRLHELPDSVKLLMDPDRPRNNRLTTTAAIDIARSTKVAELQFELAQEIVHRSLSLAEARYTIQVKTGKKITGASERKVVGFTRSPKEEYKAYKIRLGKAREIIKELAAMDFHIIYDVRDDEFRDREFDAAILADIGQDIVKLHEKIRSPK